MGSAHVEVWRSLLCEWVATRRGVAVAVDAGNVLLDYVIAHPDDVRAPAGHCTRAGTPQPHLETWIDARNVSVRSLIAAHDFFAWYIDTHLSSVADDGRLIPNGAFVNPLPRPSRPLPQSETARAALPTHYIRKLVEVLTEKDWAWAKALTEDWFVGRNPDTGQEERIWSPVRAHALAVLLLLPLRSFQLRMLDSGEGDNDVRIDGVWQKNKGPHAPRGRMRRRQGFVRLFPASRQSRAITGFFINTNKTAKTMPGTQDPGYAMPWEHAEVIAIADRLAAWQRRHNPVQGPSRWSDVADLVADPIGMARQGEVFFLFRDPLNHLPHLPVSYDALNRLWSKLLRAMEMRLHDDGLRCVDGSALSLTKTQGSRQRSLFDMHSIRVSHLSSMMNEGKVPLHILSKHVAGHASLVMTAHYIKTDPDHIDEVLSEASARTSAHAKQAFAKRLASRDREEKRFVSNDGAGIAAMAQHNVGMWRTLPTGFCPVGGTRCGDGGPALTKGRHAPVPGGALNCHSCRFHITGPAFLFGLVARFNALSLSLVGARIELDEAELALRQAENRNAKLQREDKQPNHVELAETQARHEAAVARVGGETHSLCALYTLIEQTKKVARSPSEGTDLVLAGSMEDLKTAVDESTQTGLWHAVCQGARYYQAPQLKEAVLARSQAFDRLLEESGGKPMFFRLDWREALTAGNQLMTIMGNQIGHERAVRWLDGTEPDVGAAVVDVLRRLGNAPFLETPALGDKDVE